MVNQPMALGMALCDQVIVEQGTGKTSIIGAFNKLKCTRFPAKIPPFLDTAILVGSLGAAKVEIQVTRLDTGASVIVHRKQLYFPDKLAEVLYAERLDLSPPAAGYYQFTMLAEGEWVAQRRLFLEEKS